MKCNVSVSRVPCLSTTMGTLSPTRPRLAIPIMSIGLLTSMFANSTEYVSLPEAGAIGLNKRVPGHSDSSVTAIYNRYGYVREHDRKR